jgi:hypothetical protein
MALERIIERIRQIKADITNNREADALRIAFDLSALIKLRIQTSGQNADGSAFAPYVPPYAKSRAKAGYQVGFVDYTRTGRMFAAVRPRVESSNVFSATVVIEGGDQRSKDIIAGAVKKRGNILRASAEEIALAKQANRERVQSYFRL